MKAQYYFRVIFTAIIALMLGMSTTFGANDKSRVIIETDIGGTDPDDFQSMVHFLVYADCFDIEGLISSPYGPGRKENILKVIDCYALDYKNLRTYSDRYPTPDELRAITKQGETEIAPYAGVRRSTEGSQWIVDCARREDPRPLRVLIWGGIEDLAQALHDAPDILPKLRVYWIGGPNKKWSPDAYQYIVDHHPELWIIESNATYRGWFVGGNQSGQWGNERFVTEHIAGKGALGDFFVSQMDQIKMGDTPSVGWLLKGVPDDPSQSGWGGRFVRAWEHPYARFDRLTSKEEDRIELFGILELVLPLGDGTPEKPEARLVVENQSLIGYMPGDGTMRFRFCPKAAKTYTFTIRSNVPALEGKTGGITAYPPPPSVAQRSAANLPNWWTDDPSPEVAEGPHIGTKTVNRWREDFLRNFAARMLRCQSPASAETIAFAQKKSSNLEGSAQKFSGNTKVPRVIISSDFPPTDVVMRDAPADHCSDPDDMQSMVRFLLYTNEFDVEGLVASSATFADIAKKQNMLDVIDLYDQVDENLRKHDSRYPTADYLRSVTFQGLTGSWGKSTSNNIGAGKDSEASNAIISIVDKPDPRPVWICVWGDCSNIAQAIWKVQNTRSTAELQTFLSKIRIHQIAHQDDTIDWLLENFPDLFIIYSRKTYQGMFGGSDPISDLAWVNTNIRNNHGPLCAVYPPAGMGCSGVCEGDSPSFLHLVSAVRGLNDPEDPTQPSWGGQFRRDGTTNHYVDGPGRSSISKWRHEYQADFACRADWCISHPSALAAPLKPRMIVLTDISPANHEPDDMESMIRLLVHADLFEIEGLVATTGWSYSQATTDSLNLIREVIDAYEKDLPNLLKRSGQMDFLSDESRQEIGYWPSPDYLRSRTVMGSKTRGQSHIGEGNDSPGSNLIIQIAAENDDRSVWVQAWGGGNTLAQAIWRVREKQTKDELKAFLHKIRMYTITDQDRDYRSGTPFDISSHQWMRREFEKDLFFIWDECAWKFQNGTGKSNWDEYANHIQKHGNLGNMYPKYRYGVEGDTPAFLYIMPVGLNNPDIPGQGSWGGYFEWAKGPDNKTYAYTNHQSPAYGICRELEKHFYEATFNNFAARMDWAKDGAGNRNPVVAVNGNEGMDIITLTPRQGMPVTLDASESHDPDGDDLMFNWWIISGPGSYTQDIKISNSNSSRATVDVPENSADKTFHVICEVTDDGTHNLTSYRRIIFEPVQ